MKHLIIGFVVLIGLAGCKSTFYVGSVGQQHQTQVVLTGSNFKVLGSFEGTASYRKQQVGIKDKEGLISAAKADFLQKASAAGAALTGSRAIVNVVTDIIENEHRITATYAGEVIEFNR